MAPPEGSGSDPEQRFADAPESRLLSERQLSQRAGWDGEHSPRPLLFCSGLWERFLWVLPVLVGPVGCGVDLIRPS